MMVTEQEKTLSSQGRRRIAIIGAGVSGLVAAKCLLEEGLEPIVYEQAPQIGGLWNYDEALPDGGGVMYRSLRTNTSKHTMAFSDFPLPETTPDFPSHCEVLQYLRDYAVYFGLHTYLHLNTVVESVEPTVQGQWMVCTRSGERVSTEIFEAVLVCSGHECTPQMVHPPGTETFAGSFLHSSSYKGPEEFAGKRIVVAGVGSSGVDIATELSKVAESLYLSTEHGAWFIPRYILGLPYDHHLTRLAEQLPYRLRMLIFSRLLLIEYKRMGVTPHQLQVQRLPLPTFDLWSARLTPCSDLLLRIQSGAIQVKPRMTQLKGQQVCFADGSFAEVDAVICCTGYELRLPFLSDTLLEIKQNGVELYKHVFHPDFPNLAFIGSCNVAGSTFPVVEIQGRWVARVLAGNIHLPSRGERHAAIERYHSHPSHRSPVPMQVQLLEYGEDIAGMLGVRPHIWRNLSAAPRWFFGPFSAAHYRLDKPVKKS